MRRNDGGIYRIRHRRSGHVYIGSALSVTERLADHRKRLRARTHANAHLQRAWIRDGEACFLMEKIADCEPAQLLVAEQEELDRSVMILGRDAVYNICLVARSRLGVRVSDAARHTMSIAKRGTVFSAETRKKMGEAHRGLKRSESAKERTAAKHRGMKRSADAKALWSQQRRGRVISPAQRIKIMETMKRIRAERFWSSRPTRLIVDEYA